MCHNTPGAMYHNPGLCHNRSTVWYRGAIGESKSPTAASGITGAKGGGKIGSIDRAASLTY